MALQEIAESMQAWIHLARPNMLPRVVVATAMLPN
jgi:hypothetical protein